MEPLDNATLDELLDAALVSRSLLQRESHRARVDGRSSEWWTVRQSDQAFAGMENQVRRWLVHLSRITFYDCLFFTLRPPIFGRVRRATSPRCCRASM